MVPTILAVFANDISKSLSLTTERNNLRSIFNDPAKAKLTILENADFNYMNETVIQEKLQDQIVIFHYGGHADKKNLRLINANLKIEALARMLKSFTNLQLIFLNGCDTYEQAGEIHKAGVKAAIITTIKPVNDEVATNIANYFYFAFYNSNSLNDSFESAQTRFMGKYELDDHIFLKSTSDIDEIKQKLVDRGVGPENDEDDELNTADTKKEKGVYILSFPEEGFLKHNMLSNFQYEEPDTEIDSDYQPNRTLIENIAMGIFGGETINDAFKETKEYKDLLSSYNDYNLNRDNRNFSLLVRDTLTILPFPIGFHVNKLTSNTIVPDWEKWDKDRKIELLRRQVITYNSLIQLLAFTLISSFWNELQKNKRLKISVNQWSVIKTFLSSNEITNQDINYPALLETVRTIFENNLLDPFITEYRDLRQIFDNEESFFKIHLYIQGKKNAIRCGEIKKMNITAACKETEDLLARIFLKAGFVVRYKLTTVKNIEITKSRLREKPLYHIRRIVLDRSTVDMDDIAELDDYTDSRSVILAKGIDKCTFIKFLSLSPFIIDENAQKGENLAKLYFYSHSEGNTYVYRWSEDPDIVLKVCDTTYTNIKQKTRDEIKLINERMQNIKTEMDEFKKILNP